MHEKGTPLSLLRYLSSERLRPLRKILLFNRNLKLLLLKFRIEKGKRFYI